MIQQAKDLNVYMQQFVSIFFFENALYKISLSLFSLNVLTSLLMG